MTVRFNEAFIKTTDFGPLNLQIQTSRPRTSCSRVVLSSFDQIYRYKRDEEEKEVGKMGPKRGKTAASKRKADEPAESAPENNAKNSKKAKADAQVQKVLFFLKNNKLVVCTGHSALEAFRFEARHGRAV